MRHHSYLILFLLALLLPALVQADEYKKHVDESLASMDAEADKACSHIWNVRQMMLCREDVRKKQEATGDRRATDEYCRKHYYPLDNKALLNKYDELNALRRSARAVGDIRQQYDGEMTQTAYAVEIGCIARELKRRGI